MDGVRRWAGGERASKPAIPPRRRYRKGTPGRGRDRLATRDLAVAMLAGLVPVETMGASDLADAFGLSRSQTQAILARMRRAVGGGDG